MLALILKQQAALLGDMHAYQESGCSLYDAGACAPRHGSFRRLPSCLYFSARFSWLPSPLRLLLLPLALPALRGALPLQPARKDTIALMVCNQPPCNSQTVCCSGLNELRV